MPSVLALDQGTTSSRFIVFDEGGDVIALAQKEPASEVVKAAILDTGYSEALKTENSEEAEGRLESAKRDAVAQEQPSDDVPGHGPSVGLRAAVPPGAGPRPPAGWARPRSAAAAGRVTG